MEKNNTYIRQPNNPGAVIINDKPGLEAYKKRKQRENDINTLKEEVSEIKSMLGLILDKLGSP
jgi:hypothetical protein